MALVVPNPEPVEEVEARRCLLGELSWSAAKSLPLEEFGKVDTKDRLMSVLTKGLMFDYEDLSEEEAKGARRADRLRQRHHRLDDSEGA